MSLLWQGNLKNDKAHLLKKKMNQIDLISIARTLKTIYECDIEMLFVKNY